MQKKVTAGALQREQHNLPPNKRKGFALGVHRPFLSPLLSWFLKNYSYKLLHALIQRKSYKKPLILFIRSNINSNSVVAQPLTLQNTTKSLYCLCAVLCFDLPFAITHCWPGAHVFFLLTHPTDTILLQLICVLLSHPPPTHPPRFFVSGSTAISSVALPVLHLKGKCNSTCRQFELGAARDGLTDREIRSRQKQICSAGSMCTRKGQCRKQ